MLKSRRIQPAKYVVLGFLFIILVGSILLSTPLATNSHKSVGFLDALFTATSAVCVTGLVVVDTATTWSIFGRGVIMTLIQIGGLGFMSIATLLPLILNKKIDLKDRLILKEQLNQNKLHGIVMLLIRVFKLTLIIEITGAIVLAFKFVPMFGLTKGIGYAVFHSVSAFCNAGFDLLGSKYGEFSSLIGINDSYFVLMTISILIILGGIGFPVMINLVNHRLTKERLSLNTKIVLITTAALLIVGTILFFALEYTNVDSIGNKGFFQKILNSFFQSTTTRTAGFSSLDFTKFREQTLFMMMILMFIGASPASTGGGIKTVTFAILIMNMHATIKDNSEVNIYGRRISEQTIKKALAIFMIAMIFFVLGTLILVTFEPEFDLIASAFECASAIATVGCSIGGSQNLSIIGKLLISLYMFAGRVGMITMFISLSRKTFSNTSNIRHPEENVLIG